MARPILNPISQPYYAGAPYGDALEVSGPPTFEFIPDTQQPFLKTDARAIMILVYPHHYNFIPNPAFRTDTSGWAITGSAVLDESDMWVGQSLTVNGDAMLRYQDTDMDGHLAYVYVGPSRDIHDPEWVYEPAAGSAAWTFSAFFKGTGRVRLVMDAYRRTDFSTAKSGPEFHGLTTISDPTTAPYDATKEAVLDNDGQVWLLREAPYYESLGRPHVEASPATMTNQPDQYVLSSTGHLWSAITPKPSSAPLYADLGATTLIVDDPSITDDDPEVMPPGAQYIKIQSADTARDGYVWSRIPGSYYEPTGNTAAFAQVVGEWIDINADTWDRRYIQTDTRWFVDEESGVEPALEGGGGGQNFYLVDWIDARIEIEDATNLMVSAVMLDPTEWPIASYFDGAMTEDPHLDDFLWSGAVNDSVSFYYYDRISRARWLAENLRYLIPVNRTFHIYFGSYDLPYVAPVTTTLSSGHSFTV
jgi:hypothetical protein